MQNNGNVGIGTTSPSGKLDVQGARHIPATGWQMIASFMSTDTAAAGVGAGIVLGGVYTGTTPTTFGQIAGIKENATDGNYDGSLAFSTRLNGSILNERLRILANGNVGIGTTSPGRKLDVRSSNGQSGYFEYSDTTGSATGLEVYHTGNGGTAFSV